MSHSQKKQKVSNLKYKKIVLGETIHDQSTKNPSDRSVSIRPRQAYRVISSSKFYHLAIGVCQTCGEDKITGNLVFDQNDTTLLNNCHFLDKLYVRCDKCDKCSISSLIEIIPIKTNEYYLHLSNNDGQCPICQIGH